MKNGKWKMIRLLPLEFCNERFLNRVSKLLKATEVR